MSPFDRSRPRPPRDREEDRQPEHRVGVGWVGVPQLGDEVEGIDADDRAEEAHQQQAPGDRPRPSRDKADEHRQGLEGVGGDRSHEEPPAYALVGIVTGVVPHGDEGALGEAEEDHQQDWQQPRRDADREPPAPIIRPRSCVSAQCRSPFGR